MQNQTKSTRVELFLDESGRFTETSTNPFERADSKDQSFPSQLAGLLAPTGQITAAACTGILSEVMASAGGKFEGSFHASEHLRKGSQLDSAVEKLVEALTTRGWRMVRIVNNEGVTYGDRIANYTNLVAELCLRVFQALRLQGLKNVELQLVAAKVKLGERDDGHIELLSKPDYANAIQAAMTRAAVRAGRASDARGWRVVGIRLASARTEPELMVCDLVSNASHSDFGKLGASAGSRLRDALAPLDFTLQIRADLERVDGLLADQSFGIALVHLAERMTDPDLDAKLRPGLEQRLARTVEQLADMGAPARNPQLEIVSAFLEETVRWNRDLELGRRLMKWMSSTLLPALHEKLSMRGEQEELAWFAFAIHDRSLETHNHLGELTAAQRDLAQMSRYQATMVRRWEHVDRFVQGQIHEAVHLTDAREFDKARDKAFAVAEFYKQVGELFQVELPDHFPERVRARRRGEALGTALQAEFYRGIERPEAFARARELSDLAMEEFDQADDKRRQMQYRCQLETLAGNFEGARQWLAKAMLLPDDVSHHDIATAIAGSARATERAFLALHWFRLVACMARSEDKGREDALHAAQTSRLELDSWLGDASKDHPKHAILRYQAEIALATGAQTVADTCLNRLRSICLPLPNTVSVLSFQLLACQALVAGALAESAAARSRKLLDYRDAASPGIRQMLTPLSASLGNLGQWPRFLRAIGDALDQLAQKPQATRADFAPLTRIASSIIL
jgi:hypothetical protein